MKIIKTKTEYKREKDADGKRGKYLGTDTTKAVEFSEIIDFSINQDGEPIKRIEDRLDLLEHLMLNAIKDNPEPFRDYIETCVKFANNRYWHNEKYSIKDEDT